MLTLLSPKVFSSPVGWSSVVSDARFSTIITITFCYNTSYYTVLPDIIMCWGVLLLLCQSPPSLLVVLCAHKQFDEGMQCVFVKIVTFHCVIPSSVVHPLAFSLLREREMQIVTYCETHLIVMHVIVRCTYIVFYNTMPALKWCISWCTHAHGMSWNSTHCYKT